MTVLAYGTPAAESPLSQMEIFRREPGPHDVQIDILFCGICHYDLHQARSERAGTLYPCVPGHEIVGRIADRRRPGPHPWRLFAAGGGA